MIGFKLLNFESGREGLEKSLVLLRRGFAEWPLLKLTASLWFCCVFLVGGNANAQDSSGKNLDTQGSAKQGSGILEGNSMQKSESTSYLLCKRDHLVRTVRVSIVGKRCTAIYTKSGVDEIVGNSSVHSKCFEVLGNIRTNLEKGSWKCQDISSSRVSTSNE